MFATLQLLSLNAADLPRPEHPRPDLRRDAWLSLNGEWQFAVDADGVGLEQGWQTGRDLERRITVPFCPESKLSGLGMASDYMPHVWYRRHFAVPAAMRGGRLRLHFGAVDYTARVWLNGRLLGEHSGSSTPFAFEVTDALAEGDNELVVYVVDDLRSGLQPGGKQSHGVSEGCVYTRTTGIWQTVWLEQVGETFVDELVLRPDLEGGRLLVRAGIDGPAAGVTVRLRAYDGDELVGEETVPAHWRSAEAVLKLAKVTAWEPGRPHLYRLIAETMRGGEVVDTLHSYFGMRSIRVEGNRFLINGQPVFQRLILDQGFYPDGIWTAPSDDDLRRDIELSMAAGFNGARLHQKIFDPRTLYWADKLGYLVWGEFPSWGINIDHPVGVARFAAEWFESVRRDLNHPSIVGWCPLNETGRDEYVARLETLLAPTRDIDPTRPLLDSSGYTHFLAETDVFDCHDYTQDPQAFAARYEMFGLTGTDPWHNHPGDPRSEYRGQPYFVSEYGGISLKTERTDGWGYNGAGLTVEEFFERYRALTDVLLDNPNMFGFCYTQLTDVEQEQNGIYFYDRQAKYDVARLHAINARPAAYETRGPSVRRVAWTTLAPTSEAEAQTWRYTTDEPGAGWEAPAFDDSGWSSGPGGFGTSGTPGAVVGTEWVSSDIWLRRTVELAELPAGEAFWALRLHHDEDAEVYVNGRLVGRWSGFVGSYGTVLAAALGSALREGENVIAVHCRQTAGGQFIDLGLLVGR